MTGMPGLLIIALVAGPKDGAVWLLHVHRVLEEVFQKRTWVDGGHWQSEFLHVFLQHLHALCFQTTSTLAPVRVCTYS